jgi:DNA-binding NtrC family response regulator
LGAFTDMVAQAARADVPVLIVGETGSGKEVVARHIHANSPRAAKQFIEIGCAALPFELADSELFGHEKDIFPEAATQTRGLLDEAHEGTILLDEIGDMDIRLQAKLLPVLQDGEFRRLGGRESVRVDIRTLATTNQDLRRATQEGRFREDLFFRLNVVCIRIPPLRDRRGEILPLAEHFLGKYTAPGSAALPLTQDLREAMLRYSWPGNIRELENAMRRYTILRDPALLAEELRAPEYSAEQAMGSRPGGAMLNVFDHADALYRAEQLKTFLDALHRTNWNRRKAAQLLRIDYKALLYKMRKLSIS